MKKRKLRFGRVYLLYVLLLLIAMTASVIYVYRLLVRFEYMRPETRVEETIRLLQEQVSGGDFFVTYDLQEAKASKFEQDKNIKNEYLSYFADENVSYTQKSGIHEEDELCYVIKNGDFELAEVKLKAQGDTETKLAVLNFREWTVESVQPLFEAREYKIKVPSSFHVSVNSVELGQSDGQMNDMDEMEYVVRDIYLVPDLSITDKAGRHVAYSIDQNEVNAEYYHYSLTLPVTLKVCVNNQLMEGESVSDNRVKYSILEPEKPLVEISDLFGNKEAYEGASELPMTTYHVEADSRFQVRIDGEEIPEQAIALHENREFAMLKDYVDTLPTINIYNIAILHNDAVLQVTDENGNPVSLEKDQTSYDLTTYADGNGELPKEVNDEFDVMEFARTWSLFLSQDAKFAEIQPRLIKDSYQYMVAKQYANGIDITFTSAHVLDNPPFTEEEVSNFRWITEESFCVDIHLIKHLRLKSGLAVEDEINDTFYFVKYSDGGEEPTYRMVGMKEIVNK